MSSRVLRKGKARAAARLVNYDEGAPEESEEEVAIQPPRKKPTRASARLAEPPISRDSPDEDVPPPPAKSPSPDAMQVDQDLPGPSNSTSPSGSPSEEANASDVVKPSARKVRLRLSKVNKLPPTPAEDDDEEEEEGEPEVQEEEEDDDDEEEEEDSDGGFESEEIEGPSASTSAAPSQRPSVPMTARQAALAGLGATDTPLLTLDALEANRRKGPLKTEEELALKRREAAKRRKLQLEQKTKEEKEGAVDRLLNKQAPRPRAKRNQSGIPTTTATPTGYLTPTRIPARAVELADTDTRSTSPDGEGSASAEGSFQSVPMATTIRWISTSRGIDTGRPLIEEIQSSEVKEANGDSTAEAASAMETDAPTNEAPKSDAGPSPPTETATKKPEPAFSFALSIPPNILAQLIPSAPDADAPSDKPPSPPRDLLTHCGVAGCAAARKYRVVLSTGEQKGACGLDHFRILKGVATTAGN